MHPQQNPSAQLRSLAAAQSGLVTAAQAQLLGLGNQSIRRLVAQHHWVLLNHGVYDSRPGTDSLEKAAWAAALQAGEPCAIGGEVALNLLGLHRPTQRAVVWVPADRRPRSSGPVVMRRDKIGRLERRQGLLPRIRADDAVIDIAERLGTEDAVALISEAVRRRVVTLRSLTGSIDDRSRVRNRKLLLALLADLGGIESTLEYVYRRDIERAHGLPRASRQTSVSTGTRSDVLYEEFALLVELDGRAGHLDADSAFRDLRRDNAHAQRHLVTLRYGSSDVRGRPCEVARQVFEVLRLHGWAGTITGCPRCRRRLATELRA